jgi:hypothetical protein
VSGDTNFLAAQTFQAVGSMFGLHVDDGTGVEVMDVHTFLWIHCGRHTSLLSNTHNRAIQQPNQPVPKIQPLGDFDWRPLQKLPVQKTTFLTHLRDSTIGTLMGSA